LVDNLAMSTQAYAGALAKIDRIRQAPTVEEGKRSNLSHAQRRGYQTFTLRLRTARRALAGVLHRRGRVDGASELRRHFAKRVRTTTKLKRVRPL
jgi:hypothetical protein